MMVKSLTTAQRLAFLICFLFTASLYFTSGAYAAESDTGTFGASFLRIPVGPRLLASSEIVSAMYPDASIVFSNPAALSGVAAGELFATTANWMTCR
jgi:hypothetical protein